MLLSLSLLLPLEDPSHCQEEDKMYDLIVNKESVFSLKRCDPFLLKTKEPVPQKVIEYVLAHQ